MKKLTKIKVVNWHIFYNQTLDIQGNTLISGENGSGKSTLLDAIQYLLVGGKGGVKFNLAASNEARRTLEGYVRGKIGAENKEFLRNGDIISHICLEFLDEQTNSYTLVGVVLDLPNGATLKERLYILKDMQLHEEMFFNDKTPRDFKQMKSYFKEKGVNLEYFESQKKYKEQLSTVFGLDSKKYSQLLPKALAFKPIDVHSFVFDFLLDDNPIDIQSLKNDVFQLKKIEAQIKKDKEKLEKLNLINEKGQEVEKNLDQLKVNEIIIKLNSVEKIDNNLKNRNAEIEKKELQIQDLNTKKQAQKAKIDKNDELIISLEKSKTANDLTKTIEELESSINLKANKLEEDIRLKDLILKDLDDEVINLEKLNKLVDQKALSDIIKYLKENKNNFDIVELKDYLLKEKHILKQIKEAFSQNIYIFGKEKEQISNRARELVNNKNNLSKNNKVYPTNVEILMNEINQKLSQKYQKDFNVRPLCDLVEVNDEAWRNTLEAYLTSKFDLIVEPKYFDDALTIYDNLKNEQPIYGVGLVNTSKLDNNEEVRPNSLASKLNTDYKYARLYVNMLYNNVTCVENIHDLKNFHRSVTKSGMTYQNYTAKQLNPRYYQNPFLGQKATEKQLELVDIEIKKLQKDLEELTFKTSQFELGNEILENLNFQKLLNQNNFYVFESSKTLKKEISVIEEKLQTLKQDKNYQELDNQLTILKKDKNELQLVYNSYLEQIGNLRGKVDQLILDNKEENSRISQIKNSLNELNLSNPELLNLANTDYFAYKQRFNYDFEKIYFKVDQDTNKIKNVNSRLIQEVVTNMKSYTISYSFGKEPTFENLIEFEKEANTIKNTNLLKYEEQATQLRYQTEISFKEEFINKLKSSIINSFHQIDELNQALEGKEFGNDSYKLVIKASLDPEFKRYYDLIMENTTDNQELFTEKLSRKNTEILKELYEKIASDNPEYDKLAYQFLDYRNYMSYDIEIYNKNGNVSYFSKVSREKSGGETQVPFYIVIAASFQQLLTHNKRIESGCVVLFDEAFNNMDESRIDAMMKFYNSLSIQLLISVPPQRVSNIISYVQTCLAILKINDRATIQDYTKIEKEKKLLNDNENIIEENEN